MDNPATRVMGAVEALRAEYGFKPGGRGWDGEATLELAAIEQRCERLCTRLERRGVLVRPEGVRVLRSRLEVQVAMAEVAFYDTCRRIGVRPVSWRSLPDVGRLLKSLGFVVTDLEVDTLRCIQHPVVGALVRVRAHDEALSHCNSISKYLRGESLHTEWEASGASTGRMVARAYPIQAMPALLRPLVVSRAGYCFVSWDYRFMEVVVLAGLSGDSVLTEVIGGGCDVYRFVAAGLFGMRYSDVTPPYRARGKVLLLSILYGRGAFTVGQELRLTYADAQELINRTLALFPEAADFLSRVSDYAVKNRRVVSLVGRERVFSASERRDKVRRLGANSVIQGSAATGFKERLLELDDELVARGLGETLVPLHDGGLLEIREDRVDEAVALAREILPVSPLLPLDLPVKVGLGRDWAEAEEKAV